MNLENENTRTGFAKMLYDFVNTNLEKNSAANHKNLERSIEIFTKTKECWDSSIEILETQTDSNVLTLCSSILKNKLQFDFAQLNEATFSKVHAEILRIISTHNKPTTGFRTNLGICIAFIYIHKFEQIGELLPYLSNNFSNVGNKNYIYTVLQVIPQQIDNDQLVVDEDKRKKITKYLKTIQRTVLMELNNIGQSVWESKEIKQRTLLKCFANWVEIDEDKQIIKSLPQHFLLNKAFEGLEDSDISSECTVAIKHVIRSIENPQQNAELYVFLAKRIIAFFPFIKARIQDQIYMCEDYVNIICTFARASRKQFVNNPSADYLQFINNIIYLTSEPELESEEIIFTFWEKFLTSLIPKRQSCQFYKNSLKQLFSILSNITKYSLFECQQLNQRETKDLIKVNNNFAHKIQMREEAEEIFKLISECIDAQECLTLSLNNLNSIKQTDQKMWPLVEGYLNPLENVIDQFTVPSGPLDQLIVKILEIKSPFTIVQKTFIRILSTCSIVYSKNTDFALKIFQYLVSQLENRETIHTVSRAFENVCTNNSQFVLNNVEQFISILKKHHDNQKILKGIMKALSNNDEKLNAHLVQIFSLYLTQLPTKSEIKSAKLVLEKMITIFEEITKENPGPYSQAASQCFSQLWKLIKPILQKKCNSEEEESLLEKCTKVIKYAIRCLKTYIQPFMDDIYSTILEAYRQYPLGSYVYLVEIFVAVFSKIRQFSQATKVLFDSTLEISFAHLSKQKGIESNVCLAEDFFGMLCRFLRFTPQLINNSKYFPQMLQLVGMGCSLENHELSRVFYSFVEDLFMQFWSSEDIKQYIIKQEPKDTINIEKTEEILESQNRVKNQVLKYTLIFIDKSFKQLQEGPSSSIRHAIIDTLMSEIKAFPEHNAQIWYQSLQNIPEDIITNTEKNKFIEVVGILNKENVDYLDSVIHLASKRYLHKITRSPIH